MTELNVSFYKGIDLYSDGDVEDDILEIVKNNKGRKAVYAGSGYMDEGQIFITFS